MKKMKDLAYQGDISILRVKELPSDAIKVTQKLNSADREAYGYHDEKGLVLAQGESRNHYHAFRDVDKVELFEVPANDNKLLFLVVNEPVNLVHEEHDGIEITPGIYEIFYQYEYNFEEEYVRVAD